MADNHLEYKGSILCLGGSQESLPIIRRVYDLNYRPIILDRNEDCAARHWSDERSFWIGPDKDKRASLFVKANCYDLHSCRNALVWAVTKERTKYDGWYFNLRDLVGVLCCTVDAPMVAAGLAEKYNLPTIGTEAAKYGVNKYWQYKKLSEYNILVPPTKIVNPEMSWDEVSDYDIVKPADSRGARGVRFYDESNYKEAFTMSLAWSKLRSIIVQRFIHGKQLSTESVIYNGVVSMTAIQERNYDRLAEFAPYIVEDGSDTYLPSPLNKRINELIEKCCIALGWDNCTVKGDLILDGGLLYVIELAPRLSGGYFASHIIPSSMGWDILADAIALATGNRPIIHLDKVEQFVSQRYLFPRREWVGKLISKLPQFPSSVNFGTWNVKIGDKIYPTIHHPSRLGQVICTGQTYTEAVSKAVGTVKRLIEEVEVE